LVLPSQFVLTEVDEESSDDGIDDEHSSCCQTPPRRPENANEINITIAKFSHRHRHR
jgi:hypothetical protein